MNEQVTTVYVSIGNSDDRLSQAAWSAFLSEFQCAMREHAMQIFGEWHSPTGSSYQNACIAAAVPAASVEALRDELSEMRGHYRQDAIAWAVVAETEFLR